MPITISIGLEGVSLNDSGSARRIREHKGKNIIALPNNYTIIDLETTGLDPSFDSIIEFAAMRIRNGSVEQTFQTLVKPYDEIDDFITELTGITAEMLVSAPLPEEIFPAIYDFIGSDVVVGHNSNFDVNFLYDWFEIILKRDFSNPYIDTMRFARKLLPELKHHRLCDISESLHVMPTDLHRAMKDCQTTYKCFLKLSELAVEKYGTEAEFAKSFAQKRNKFDVRSVSTEKTEFDETHPLYGKVCVFTGKLDKMSRRDAAQFVVDFGGICDEGITKKTNYLILGDNDYCKTIKNGKSTKHKKAEQYKLNGYDIEIISEDVFYNMIYD